MPSEKPSFESKAFLEQHIQSTLNFYEPNVLDLNGGFFQHFHDDGHVYDNHTRHLVSSTRFVFNYAQSARYFSNQQHKSWVKHGLDYLQSAHYQADTGGYAWLIDDQPGKSQQQKIIDATNHCYGLAFVMVAGSTALLAEVDEGKHYIENAWNLMSEHFWDSEQTLYADEANADFSIISPYRGQNANMHACEGLIWAYHATEDQRYLDRALQIADAVCNRLASQADSLIWEHYTEDWQIDWEYNKQDPKHLFRPWGFQPGHQTEWAKLLCQLHKLAPKQSWLLSRAIALFDVALETAWDDVNGGICYGFAPDKSICDDDKYFWVQAETFAAAYRLYKLTGEQKYLSWYQKIWDYSWQHMVDHKHGAWFRILTADNQKIEPFKSPAGKTDYHTMGACYEVLGEL